MHLEHTIHTCEIDPERRAVDVNRPGMNLVRSGCGIASAVTDCYRGIDITRSPWPFFCGRSDGREPNCIEVLWNSGVGRVKIRESEARAEPPNDGPRCE